ncbi:hypothetical protein [Paracoccus sulfuroxidans]|uniref:Uncharacterized protein n=1 Tax=Paracoccus sulfuroxidans TaxID=384678 RepID=A0A562NM03_9RHOB|nr:hypothetical protein [Paracoccus sulfuroxidans]TWI32776.1 hypothetical protein IQ24_02651 [Paracoccus sulfuroxidans]
MIDHSNAIADLMAEREAFPAASPDWLYRSRAAWKLHQHQIGVPARDWTDEPAGGFRLPQPQYGVAAE